jgi:hypothetical protein
LPTMSPPPPDRPWGALWQPVQEFASGPEMRLNARMCVSGCDGSDSGRPVPFVSGRPAPSCSVQRASKSSCPCASNDSRDIENSCPSRKCDGTATSRPIRDERAGSVAAD